MLPNQLRHIGQSHFYNSEQDKNNIFVKEKGKIMENNNDSFGNSCIIMDETDISHISLSKEKKKFQVWHHHNA